MKLPPGVERGPKSWLNTLKSESPVIKGLSVPLTRFFALVYILDLGFTLKQRGNILFQSSKRTELMKAGLRMDSNTFFAPSGDKLYPLTVHNCLANSRIPPSKPFIGFTSTPKRVSKSLYSFETFLLAIATSSPRTP